MEKEKIDKKDHILDVAEKIFSELGYDGASTRLISGEAGVNMAMLNYYFGSKEGLYLAIFKRKISASLAVLQNIGNDDTITAWGKMERYIDNYVEKIITNTCFQKLINRELSSGKNSELTEKMTSLLMTNVLEFKKIILDGINTGIFRADIDPDLAILTVFGTKHYLINSPHFVSTMLGHDIRDDAYLDAELKPRLKIYMKQLMKSYLVK